MPGYVNDVQNNTPRPEDLAHRRHRLGDQLDAQTQASNFRVTNRATTGNNTFGINRATQNWSYTYSPIDTLTNRN